MSTPHEPGRTARSSRTELMRPAQLLLVAFGCAAFAAIVTAVSMGAFTSASDAVHAALQMAAVVGGITFIVTLVGLALLLLAVDPREVTRTVDRGVLLVDEPGESAGAGQPGGGSANEPEGPAER